MPTDYCRSAMRKTKTTVGGSVLSAWRKWLLVYCCICADVVQRWIYALRATYLQISLAQVVSQIRDVSVSGLGEGAEVDSGFPPSSRANGVAAYVRVISSSAYSSILKPMASVELFPPAFILAVGSTQFLSSGNRVSSLRNEAAVAWIYRLTSTSAEVKNAWR
jgi:hypothetical protein